MANLNFKFTEAGQITDGRPDREETEVDIIFITVNDQPVSPNIHGEEKKALFQAALSAGFYIQAIGSTTKEGENRTYAKVIKVDAPQLAA